MKISLQIKRKILLLSILFFSFTTAFSQFENLKFGTDSTLDVVTWNIEHFPKNGQTTIDFVAQIMIAIDADVYAIQEVTSEDDLQQLVSQMDGWSYAYAYNQYAALAFVYKADSIRDVNFFEIYTSNSRVFPRSPFVMEFTFMAQPFSIINNHLKCCGDNVLNLNDDWDEEKRRLDACVLLDEYIETYYNDSKVIVTGDLNDVLIDDFEDNVFEIFIQNDLNYLVTDMEIAEGDESDWSYPSWPSHLDHIIITNEFFDNYNKPESQTITIKPDEYFEQGFSEYDDMVTDHRPVGIRLKTESFIGVEENQTLPAVNIYPNPVGENLEVWLSGISGFDMYKIFNFSGSLIKQQKIVSDIEKLTLDPSKFKSGIYYIKFINSRGNYVVSRFVIK